MFVTSEWEPDVPKEDVSFGKKAAKRKLPKNIVTSTNQVASIENAKQVKTKGFPTNTTKKKYEKPVRAPAKLSSPQKPFGSEQTTKSKKKKKRNKKSSIPPPGMFVKNPSVTLPDNSKHTKNNEKQDAAPKQNEAKSSQISEPTKPINTDKSITNSKKRKNEAPTNTKPKKFKLSEQTKTRLNQSLDKPDELLLKLKRKQLVDQIKSEDREDLLFKETGKKTKGQIMKSKERLKMVLSRDLERNSVKAGGNKLRERMLEKLKAAQFRYLNEKLYTSSGSEAQQLFQADPDAFQTYHEGYQLQLRKWPVNPLDIIVKSILKMPKSITIADMGCGEATLAKRVPQAVRSFDLVARAPGVEACDMAHTPLLAGSVDVAVYCLALMGTDLTQYLVEANRVLKQGGLLLIAEVESRFEDVDAFAKEVARLGFKLLKLDKSHQVFFFMEFRKMQPPPAKKAKQPKLSLKPCIYKRR